jgi:MFS family permease
MTIVITLIADYFEGKERQNFAGIQVAFMSIGGIILVSLGGFLADISWRTPFLIYVVSLAFLPMAIIHLYEPKIERTPAEILDQPKAPSLTWLLIINTMIMWILFFILPVHLPFFLKSLGVEKNALIGIAVAVSTLFSAVSSFSYAKMKGRFSYYSIFFMGYLIMAIGLLLTSMASNYLWVLLAMMFSGFGIGMMIPNTNLWIMQITPPAIRGKEIGKLTMFWFMGQFLSPIITLPLAKSFELSKIFMVAAWILLSLSLVFLMLHLSSRNKTIQGNITTN